jgi:predicted Zn-dependent protease
MKAGFNSAATTGVLLLCLFSWQAFAQVPTRQQGSSSNDLPTRDQQDDPHADLNAEDELRQGTALTRKGNFSEAIPHLLAARGKVSNEYAAGFNLALCYVATRQYSQAIRLLTDLRRNDMQREGHNLADVNNLLAQAYIGNGQSDDALTAFKSAAAMTPQNEKLYLLVADASTEHEDFSLGLKIVDLGLQNLPQSPRLHYQHAMLLWQLDQFDRAKADFALAGKLGQGSDIGYIASAHEALLKGDVANAAKIAREGTGKGLNSPILLTILGEALVRSGVAPGEPEFSEAQSALEQAVTTRPNDATAQIALGQIYLADGRLVDAIQHLERAQQLQPDQPSVYASLAKAYQRRGDSQRAQQALAMLEKMNEAQAEKIRSAPGDRKMGYGGGDRSAQESPRQ